MYIHTYIAIQVQVNVYTYNIQKVYSIELYILYILAHLYVVFLQRYIHIVYDVYID